MIQPRTIRQIAELHADQLHVGAMAACGVGFIESFYRRAAKDRDAVLVAHTDGGRVVGFALATTRPSAFYARTVLLLAPNIAWQLIKRPGLLVRLASIGSYVSGRSSERRPSEPELLSIAVRPDRHGTGTGTELLKEIRGRLKSSGTSRYVVTASDTQEKAMRFYQKHGGVVVSEMDLGGLRSFTYAMPV